MWRTGYVEGPAVCDLSQPWEECKCTCSKATFEGKTPAEILEDSGVLMGGGFYDSNSTFIDSLSDEEGNAFDAIPGYSRKETGGIYARMLRALCTPMKIGTHYEASSTNDPTFWVLHPTFDRLWHLNRLEDNPIFDQTWQADSTLCYGHNPDDIQPFHDLFLLADPVSEGTRLPLGDEVTEDEKEKEMKHYYTNQELYTQLKPDEMSSPYIYEHFEWLHCEEQGIFIRGPH